MEGERKQGRGGEVEIALGLVLPETRTDFVQ